MALTTDPLFAGTNVTTLLGRPLRPIPTERGRRLLAGARVLVTGAGGSVGSAVIARLMSTGVERIIALDHHEGSLFRLARDLPGAPLDPVLVDVRNRDKLGRIFSDRRPNFVFHLAAYKHVPLAEYGPDEFVAVNVLGTETVARAAGEAGVGQFVYPSSDKAVNPPSAYGATKRLAETLLLALGADDPAMAVHVVRYVNILGTNGSWPETIAHQARAGTPMTLTDERMARYWMAMDEAIDLLWHSLGLPSGSRTVLDTGDPIPTRTMGERIVRLVQGEAAQPEFALIGARPGERLLEELASEGERLERSPEDPVLRVLRDDHHEQYGIIESGLQELRGLLAGGEQKLLHQRLLELAHLLQ